VDQCFEQVRAANPSPLAAIFASLEEMTRFCNTPESMANSLAFLQIDLTDPDFHRIALENSRAIQAGYRALVEDAIAARELVECDADRVARTLQVTANGSMLGWAIVREGALIDWLRRDLETLLDPLRRRTRAKDARPTSRARPAARSKTRRK
jgi:hypothetical protein